MTHSRTFSGCSTLALALTAMCLPTLAFGACEDVRDRIAQNIESNGVAHMGYSLQVIPTADADQVEGQIVGHCESNQYQIVYQRHYRTSSAETMEDASADEDEIDGAPTTESSAPAANDTDMSGASSSAMEDSMKDSETSTPDQAIPNQADDADAPDSDSNSRRVETSDMPVSTEPASTNTP